MHKIKKSLEGLLVGWGKWGTRSTHGWPMIYALVSTGSLEVENLIVFWSGIIGQLLVVLCNEMGALWWLVVDIKDGSMCASWCSNAVNVSCGVGAWRSICCGWGNSPAPFRHLMGDGTKIRFQHNTWCIDRTLKEVYRKLFRISCCKEASIADLCQVNNGIPWWSSTFTRLVQDWEVETVPSLLNLFYSFMVREGHENKMGGFIPKQ